LEDSITTVNYMKIPFLKNKNYEEFNTFTKIRLCISIIVLFLLLILVLFLYKDFYRTIIQANEVVVLKQEVAMESIDLKKFNQVFSVHTYKRKKILPEIIPNPFMTGIVKNIIQESSINSEGN